jgi:predicted amidohydrolase
MVLSPSEGEHMTLQERKLTVASLAMRCDQEPGVNRDRMVGIVEAVMGAHPGVEIILFGEMTLGWYQPGKDAGYHQRISEPLRGETLQVLSPLAKRYGIYLCYGMSELDQGRLYNTQVLLDPRGEVQAVHRKLNLKNDEIAAGYQPGPSRVTITEVKGIRTGLVICSDAASPKTMIELVKSRLDLILQGLADDHDEDRFAAKFNASMYDAWFVTANRFGDEDGHFWNGHLVVSDPWGRLRAGSQDQPGHLVYEIEFTENKAWLVSCLRQIVVKTPLIFHLIMNWRKIRIYL